jgi:MFS family permease
MLARFLTGLGSGGANVPIMGLLVAWYEPKRRGLAAGIAVSGSSFGLLTTGLLIPAILGRFGEAGWRVSWYTLAGAAAVIAVAASLLLRNRPSVSRDQGTTGGEVAPDGVSSASRGATARLDVTTDRSVTDDDTGTDTRKSDDMRAEESHRRAFGRILRSRQVWRLSAIYVTFGFSYVIYATFFARGLISAGFSEGHAGRLWSGIGAASIASGFIWGVVSDRIGRRYALALIYLLQGASFLVFGLCSLTGSFEGGYYISAVLFALTAFSIPAVMSAAAGDLIGPRLASAAFGVITLFFGVGQIFGPFVAGRIAESFGGYGPAFVLAAAVAGAGALLSAVLIPTKLTTPEAG